MTTLLVRGNSSESQQFLEFAKTLPYIDVVEENGKPVKEVKRVVADALKKSEQGVDLTVCEDADDMFKKLGI